MARTQDVSVTMRDGDGVFLDDLRPREIEERLGVKVRVVEPTARGLVQGLLK